MYEVTETYKTESRKQVRNQSHVSIEFRIEEVFFKILFQRQKEIGENDSEDQ